MNSDNTDLSRFLGLNLAQWLRQWCSTASALLDLPGLRWLVPQAVVTLRQANGRYSSWLMERGQAFPLVSIDAQSEFQAIELAPQRVLERRIMLPPLASADLEQAVRLDIASASPFAAAETVIGYVANRVDEKVISIDVAITSKRQLQEALLEADCPDEMPPEVWFFPSEGHTPSSQAASKRPIVMPGFGESRRQAMVRQGTVRRVGLLAIGIAFAAALVATPILFARYRAQQAQASFAQLQQRAAPQIAKRESLMLRVERLRGVGELLDRQLALAPVLAMLTRVIPDGAWLDSLRIEKAKIVIRGYADDAAALVQRLSEEAGIHGARLASPATRSSDSDKERFVIELTVERGLYGVAHTASEETK